MSESTDTQALPPPAPPRRQTLVVAPVVLIAVVVALAVFDALTGGDGDVGVTSEAVPVTHDRSEDGDLETLAGYRAGATMTIGFPLDNRGVLPLRVTGVRPLPDTSAAGPATDGSCEWRVTDVRTARNAVRADGVAVQIPARGHTALFVEATFDPDPCEAPPGVRRHEALVVDYRILGLLPRRQVIPLATPLIITYDPDDPRLQVVE